MKQTGCKKWDPPVKATVAPELAPCPMNDRCGADASPLEYQVDRMALRIRVSCGCGVCGPWGDTVPEALEGWNLLPREEAP